MMVRRHQVEYAVTVEVTDPHRRWSFTRRVVQWVGKCAVAMTK